MDKRYFVLVVLSLTLVFAAGLGQLRKSSL